MTNVLSKLVTRSAPRRWATSASGGGARSFGTIHKYSTSAAGSSTSAILNRGAQVRRDTTAAATKPSTAAAAAASANGAAMAVPNAALVEALSQDGNVPEWMRKNDTFPKRHIGPSE